jgi:1-acyl-sn-glycerol-3-phosphate acyltransferase
MTNWRRFYRLVLLIAHVIAGAVLTVVFAPKFSSSRAHSSFAAITQWWHRRLCRILRLAITVDGPAVPGPALLVANHISWLDIPVLGGLFAPSFLSKAEVRDWPLVGWMAHRAGTLFIQRGDHGAAAMAVAEMTSQLVQGRNVLVFAEGRTTKGKDVRRFHARPFAAAVQANCVVQPVAILYPHSTGIHPAAPFVDNMPFLSHLINVLAQPELRVMVQLCAPLEARDGARRELAERARAAVRAQIVGVTNPDHQECQGVHEAS